MEKYGIKNFAKINLGGTIKKSPEDFVVEEITTDGKVCCANYSIAERLRDLFPGERKEQLHFTLVKKSWTTLRAISKLSEKLRISRRRFGFAGSKDRQAVTAQRISVWNMDVSKLKKIKLKDIRLKNFSYSNKRITLGDLYGNRFTITVRNPNQFSKKELKKTLEDGIPNYFGPQRFGIQRNMNHLIGKQLLLGNFEEAVRILITKEGNENIESKSARKFAAENWGDWNSILRIWPKNLGIEAAVLNYLVKYPHDYANALRKLPKNLRRMFIHAFQSYIFNLTLSSLEKYPEKIQLVGYDTKLEGETGNLISGFLKQENIKLSDFKLKRMPKLAEPGIERSATIFPEDVDILKASKNSVKLRFSLKKGAYATTVLMYLGVKM